MPPSSLEGWYRNGTHQVDIVSASTNRQDRKFRTSIGALDCETVDRKEPTKVSSDNYDDLRVDRK